MRRHEKRQVRERARAWGDAIATPAFGADLDDDGWRRQEQARFLNKQMLDLEERKARERAEMSEVERKFNAAILDKVKAWQLTSVIESGLRRPY